MWWIQVGFPFFISAFDVVIEDAVKLAVDHRGLVSDLAGVDVTVSGRLGFGAWGGGIPREGPIVLGIFAGVGGV